MNYTIDDLNKMTDAELQTVIQKDADEGGDLLYDLEAELMGMMHDGVFPGSETFNDVMSESNPERYVRVVLESLDFMATLNAINALNNKDEKGILAYG